MSKTKKSFILDYTPARYSDGKDAHVSYYVLNPFTQRKCRIKIRLNYIKKSRERRAYANEIVRKLNVDLSKGWNPFVAENAPKGFKLLTAALDQFIATRTNEWSANTLRTYKSQVTRFKKWLVLDDNEQVFVLNFKKTNAITFLNHINNQNLSSRTYNNYVRNYVTIWNWFSHQEYAVENPFEGIPRKKVTQKERIFIPHQFRTKLTTHLENTDPPFLMCCLILFYCLIRPNEITHLRVEDINFKRQVIYVSSESSKNNTADFVTIPNVFIKRLTDYITKIQHKPGQYIFSDRQTLSPGDTRLDPRVLTRRWSNMRPALGMPVKMQMYSLKDTGIIELFNSGVPHHEIMKQARHSSLEVTTQYLKHSNTQINKELQYLTSDF